MLHKKQKMALFGVMAETKDGTECFPTGQRQRQQTIFHTAKTNHFNNNTYDDYDKDYRYINEAVTMTSKVRTHPTTAPPKPNTPILPVASKELQARYASLLAAMPSRRTRKWLATTVRFLGLVDLQPQERHRFFTHQYDANVWSASTCSSYWGAVISALRTLEISLTPVDRETGKMLDRLTGLSIANAPMAMPYSATTAQRLGRRD
jgi:hypothetical protein